MTENFENLILEQLRHIGGRIDWMADDMGTMELRLSSPEGQVADLHGDNAIVHQQPERIEGRLETMGRRLDLSEPV
jgi:hypothetical protein